MTSFDTKTDFFSLLAKNISIENPKQYIKNTVKNSFDFVSRYLSFLPPIDQDIARMYYVDGMSQDQIKKMFGVCQAAISRRVKYIFVRIKFLLRAPSLNPIQVREELRILFDDNLFEFAYFFYWELAQNRVKYYIETSQSGAANKLIKILRYLKELSSILPREGESLSPIQEKKKYLALVYLDYFQFIYKKSNVITFVFKKSDKYKPNSLHLGENIFNPPSIVPLSSTVSPVDSSLQISLGIVGSGFIGTGNVNCSDKLQINIEETALTSDTQVVS